MNLVARGIGFFLLVAGWWVMLAAVVLVHGKPTLPLFAVLSLAGQALGLTMVVRTHSRG